ncbi:hypothetical protein PALB_600 [Pseudoalteromonas luteoviolacea B = ATCC 29581]|nr:hypothetical protein PALB_600 [Pseudoalteromonas luteoviolacea B = ATCC 29581]
MFTHIFKYMMMLLVMWQSLAFAAMPCHAMPHSDLTSIMPTHDHVMDMPSTSDNGHAHHTLSNSNKAEAQTDCCQITCHCPANACGAAPLVNVFDSSRFQGFGAEKVVFPEQRFDSTPSPSLYKPPIFA